MKPTASFRNNQENRGPEDLVFGTFQENPPESHRSLFTPKEAGDFIDRKVTLPTSFSLRTKMDAVYDQGNIGSCTSNAVCSAIRYIYPGFHPSRLFQYYNARTNKSQDTGSSIYGNIMTTKLNGLCKETTWPYVASNFTIAPPSGAYSEAQNFQVLKESPLKKELTTLKACIYAGFPFVMGFTVYRSMYECMKAPYIIPVPTPETGDEYLGGHCVLICGYDDTKSLFLIKNSWGTGRGDAGYFYMSYDFLMSGYSWDFWQINQIEQVEPILHAPTPTSLVKEPTMTTGNTTQVLRRGYIYKLYFKVTNNDSVTRNMDFSQSFSNNISNQLYMTTKLMIANSTFNNYITILIPNNIQPQNVTLSLKSTVKETGANSSVNFSLVIQK